MKRWVGLILLWLTESVALAANWPTYAVHSFGADFGTVFEMNNRGDLIGFTSTGDSHRYFQLSGGQRTYLPEFFEANKINDQGVIAGALVTPGEQGASSKPAFLRNGHVTVLDTPGPIGIATGINSRGDLAGTYLTDALQSRAFSYVNGQLNFLPALHPDDPSAAAAINDAGTVVGSVGGPFGLVGPAVAWTPDGIQELTGRYGMGTAINNRGTIVGYDRGNSSMDTAAFIKYADGGVQTWFPPSGEASVAFDVNSADVAVGSYYYPQLWDSAGVLFIKDTQLWLDDLIDPASGWQIKAAGAINDAGEILATGCRAGVCSSVMLMPVPEPAEAVLLVTGLLVLAGRGRWRDRNGSNHATR